MTATQKVKALKARTAEELDALQAQLERLCLAEEDCEDDSEEDTEEFEICEVPPDSP